MGKKADIVLYGASLTGQMALNFYGKERVRYFCDGDKNKIGTFVDGVEVISKEHLAEIKDEIELVITSNKYEAIMKELNRLGIFGYKVFDVKKSPYNPEEYNNFKNTIHQINAQYFEEKSDVLYDEKFSVNITGKKIVFVLYSHVDWIVVASLFKAAENEHCYCVVLNHNYDLLNELKAKGIEAYYAEEYRIEEDLPDIVIYNSDWYDYKGYSIAPENARKFAKKLILVPIDMVIYAGPSIPELAETYLMQNADMCFVNPDFYQKFKPYQNNLVLEGNPKFDYIYEKLANKDVTVPDEWKKKIGNKKVIMWATSHGIYGKNICPSYTFDLWVKDIIDYFREHKEYVLIFRPSALIFQDLIVSGICTYDECRHFEEMFERESNFIFDRTPDYGLAYKVSDALVCCPNGMLLSYLPTKKPIVYTATYRMNYSFSDPELIQNYYIAKDREELEQSIEQIFNQNDPLYEKRMQTLKQYVPCFDGKIGERIMQRILASL